MAYWGFTALSQLQDKFGIEHRIVPLFDKEKLAAVAPSDILMRQLKWAKRLPLFTEKGKSESVISPILEEVWDTSTVSFTFFSGFTFDVDKAKKLTGRCDYIFSKEPDKIEITAPVFCLVEAKDRTIVEGIPQAFAEMYAAALFNEKHGFSHAVMHGCVTNAVSWRFLELHEGKYARIDGVGYATDSELSLLLSNF